MIAILAPEVDGDAAARRAHLASLWEVCLVEPRDPPGEGGLREAERAITDGLGQVGLIGFDPADLVTVAAAPSLGELYVVSYQPGADVWSLPDGLGPVIAAAERLLVVIRCGPATTLFDLNAICRAIGAEAAPEVPILIAAPVADGSPVVAVIAIAGIGGRDP